VVRRRFARGLRNFFQIYAPVVDSWLLFDSSQEFPELFALSIEGVQPVFDRELFAAIKREARES